MQSLPKKRGHLRSGPCVFDTVHNARKIVRKAKVQCKIWRCDDEKEDDSIFSARWKLIFCELVVLLKRGYWHADRPQLRWHTFSQTRYSSYGTCAVPVKKLYNRYSATPGRSDRMIKYLRLKWMKSNTAADVNSWAETHPSLPDAAATSINDKWCTIRYSGKRQSPF